MTDEQPTLTATALDAGVYPCVKLTRQPSDHGARAWQAEKGGYIELLWERQEKDGTVVESIRTIHVTRARALQAMSSLVNAKAYV